MFRIPENRELVAELADHPAWPLLRERVKEAREQYFRNLGKSLYAGTAVTAEDVAYKRGFFRGAFFLLNTPVFDQMMVDQAIDSTEEVTD